LLALPAFSFENHSIKSSSDNCGNCETADIFCDDLVREAMAKCWEQSMSGLSDKEYGFTVTRKEVGFLVVYSKSDNFFRRAKIGIPIESIMLFHTHPNSVPPDPSPKDKQIANEINMPVCTITGRGVFCYYPDRNKTIKVRDNLTWLKPCNSTADLVVRLAP